MRLSCVSACQDFVCADLIPSDCFDALPRCCLSASCNAGRSSLAVHEITNRKASSTDRQPTLVESHFVPNMPQVTSEDITGSFGCLETRRIIQCVSLYSVLLWTVFIQGRGYTSSAAITTVVNVIIITLSQNLAYQVAGSSSQANVSPDFYIQPIKMLDFNLAPVHTLGQNLATYLLCVLIWLGATFIVSSMYPFATQTEEAVVANILAKGATTGERKQVLA